MGALLDDLTLAAREAGFGDLAVTDAAPFDEWREINARTGVGRGLTHDPAQILPGGRSLIALVYPYAPFDASGLTPDDGRVSAYYPASNRAYAAAHALAGKLSGFAALASPSLPYKALARRAGLGTDGYNTLLMHPVYGSHIALQVILTDAPLERRAFSGEPPAHGSACGRCRVCVDACPVGALAGDGNLAPGRCLRMPMLTGRIVPHELREPMGLRLLGCDDCRTCCPRNGRRSVPMPADTRALFSLTALLSLKGPALRGHMENIALLVGRNAAAAERWQAQAALCAGNTGDAGYSPMLLPLLESGSEAARAHAAWSLARLGERRAVLNAAERENNPLVAEDMRRSLAII